MRPLQQLPLQINVVIPVLNEEMMIAKVLSSLSDIPWINTIIVVDDGSTDASGKIIKNFPVVYLKNKKNRGIGYSLLKGLKYSKKLGNTQYTATIDADGQHDIKDLERLYQSIIEKPVLITHAVRNIDADAPPIKKFPTFLAWAALALFYGNTIPDVFCGLNIFHSDIISSIKWKNGYDWPIALMQLMQLLAKHVVFVHVPARYSEYSLSKGMTTARGIKVFSSILSNRFKELRNEKGSRYNQSILPASWRN